MKLLPLKPREGAGLKGPGFELLCSRALSKTVCSPAKASTEQSLRLNWKQMLINWNDFGYIVGLVVLAAYAYGREIGDLSPETEPCAAFDGSNEPESGSVSMPDCAPYSDSADERFTASCEESLPGRASGLTSFRRVMPHGRQQSLVRWYEIYSRFIRGPGEEFGRIGPATTKA